MTIKEFSRLKPGTRVRWREDGAITTTGVVTHSGVRLFIIWPDGQETESFDEWALLHVEVADAAGGVRVKGKGVA